VSLSPRSSRASEAEKSSALVRGEKEAVGVPASTAEKANGEGGDGGTPSSFHRSQESLVTVVTITDAESSVSRPPLEPSSGPAAAGSDPRLTKLLVDLWLMSAASFRRWGKLEDALDAIREAEALDPTDADVWVQVSPFSGLATCSRSLYAPSELQLALYHVAHSDRPLAFTCLQKATTFTKSLSHVGAQVHLARLLIFDGSADIAEAVLRHVTETQGWNVAEAWYLLGRCYEAAQPTKAKECLEWALKLEQTKPLRDPRKALPGCL
jgi:tetratricopeptide (TPR) repeat protein